MPRKDQPPATLTITLMKGGTYTIHLNRPGKAPERYRTGVTNEPEALKRAEIIAELCGYKFDRKVKVA